MMRSIAHTSLPTYSGIGPGRSELSLSIDSDYEGHQPRPRKDFMEQEMVGST